MGNCLDGVRWTWYVKGFRESAAVVGVGVGVEDTEASESCEGVVVVVVIDRRKKLWTNAGRGAGRGRRKDIGEAIERVV